MTRWPYAIATDVERREQIKKHARNATEAVQIAARQVGSELAGYQAQWVAEVARTFAEGGSAVREACPRQMWEIEDYRQHVRREMRFRLLDELTSQGFIPVDLPSETLRYLGRWGFMAGDDLERAEGIPEIPAEAVEQGAEWETVILTLTVPVRRPPVDRAAAVKAGILTGPGT